MTDPALNITGTFTPADMLSAFRLHMRPRGLRLAMHGVVVIAAVWLVWEMVFGDAAEGNDWIRWFVPGFFLYLIVSYTVVIPFISNRAYRQRKDLQRPCAYGASDAGLHFSTENMQGTTPWSDYLKWKEGDATLLLYFSDYMYQVIPKRFFASQADLDAFRALVARKIPRRVA